MVLRMEMDSLRYWHQEMGVDGFRFDLATTLARVNGEYNEHAGFLDAMAQDPALSAVKLIAEPWDTGTNGYQVGNFPPGWAEWNDRIGTPTEVLEGRRGCPAGLCLAVFRIGRHA